MTEASFGSTARADSKAWRTTGQSKSKTRIIASA